MIGMIILYGIAVVAYLLGVVLVHGLFFMDSPPALWPKRDRIIVGIVAVLWPITLPVLLIWLVWLLIIQ